MYLGSWKIDDFLTFYANTQVFATGVATDADAVPAYRVYEDETGTAILTGNMALIDSGNTAGFYSEQITLSAANGFEKGKCYSIYISATVSSVAGATHKTFQIEAEVDANVVSDKTGYAIASGGIAAAAFAAGAIDAAAIAANAIGASEIADGAIDAGAIAADAITAAKIADGAIDAATFAAGAITATVVATGAIDADALAADAVTEIWAKVIETEGSYTAQQALSITLAVLAGVTSNAGATFETPNGVADRVVSTVDGSQNRTAQTVTPSA